MREIELNNGIKMPQLGLGTFLIPQKELSRTIGEAYELGYRLFDTAWRYHNEADIAQALKDNGIRREDVFITTKVNADALYTEDYKYGRHHFLNKRNHKTMHDVVQESFDNLATDYIDLFLIHWPWEMTAAMWDELSKRYKSGQIRAIGVSNFLQPHLEYLREISDITPAVNQFEISPLNRQQELIDYCKAHGIAVQAMSTFSHYRSVEPRKELFESSILTEIAHKHNKSIVQIVLRWMMQQDIIMIPKTWNHDYLKESISIFDFELSPEDKARIDSMNRGRWLNYIPLGEQWWLPRHLRKWKGFDEWDNYVKRSSLSKCVTKWFGI